jgi:hypothetical protein
VAGADHADSVNGVLGRPVRSAGHLDDLAVVAPVAFTDGIARLRAARAWGSVCAASNAATTWRRCSVGSASAFALRAGVSSWWRTVL